MIIVQDPTMQNSRANLIDLCNLSPVAVDLVRSGEWTSLIDLTMASPIDLTMASPLSVSGRLSMLDYNVTPYQLSPVHESSCGILLTAADAEQFDEDIAKLYVDNGPPTPSFFDYELEKYRREFEASLDQIQMEKEEAEAEMKRLFDEHYPGSTLVVDSPDVTFLDA